MAFATLTVPAEMTIETAQAICMVIVTLTLSLNVTAWLFSRLTPARRRDVIRLVQALRLGGGRRG